MTALFFFQNPRLLIIAVFTIVASGVGAFWLLPRIEDPILKKRVGVVTTVFPGATASQMESLVAIPIEQTLESVRQVASVKSNCRANITTVVIELREDVTDVDAAWSVIRNEIVKLKDELPAASGEPELEIFPLKAFASIIALHSDEVDWGKLRSLAQEMKSRIHALPGTESVSLFGDPGLEVAVRITPSELVEHGITVGRLASEVERTITTESIGILDQDQSRIQVTLKEPGSPVEKIRRFQFRDNNGQLVRIGDIANVRLQAQRDVQEKCLVDGRSAVVLAAMVEDDFRVDHWDDRLQEVLDEIRRDQPGVEVEEIFSQRQHIERRMTRLFRNLVFSSIAVILVVLLLMGWKSMLVVIVALPLTVLIVLTGMRLLSVPIHQMSVTGIIVSLGLLIDNAIVVVEDIRKKIFLGIQPYSAIRKSIHHLRFPLLGATVTTALSFLPIALLPGSAGEFVGSIAITVILAVVASYFVAILILPALVGNIGIEPRQRNVLQYGIHYQPISDAYLGSLRYVLERPWVGIMLGVFLPVIGFLAWMHLPVQFFPPSDRRQLEVEIELSNRSSFEALEASVEQVRRLIDEDSRVLQQNWFLGRSAPTFYYNVVPRRKSSPYYAQAFIRLAGGSGGATPDEIARDLQAVLNQVDDARVTVRLLEQGPPFDSPIEIRLLGPDRQQLVEAGNQLRNLLAATPGVIQTRSDLAETIMAYEFVPQADAFTDSAFSPGDISTALRAAIHGVSAGELIAVDEIMPVQVRLLLAEQDVLPDVLLALPLSSPPIPTPGESRPAIPTVGMFGEFQIESQAAAILRLNGERVNEIKGYLEVGRLPSEVLERFRQRLAQADWKLPDGCRIEYGGENERRSTAVGNLVAYAPVFLLLILFLIVAIFGAFHAGLYVALVGGLTIGLVPLALATFGFPFGFMAIVGAMGLIGIAINDSIVVMASLFALDRYERSQVEDVARSVLDNTRHIIATTLTTIAGFVPLVVGEGRFWPPMAISLAGGILGATFLAVYFVPSLFILFQWGTDWYEAFHDDSDEELMEESAV